MIKELTCIGCPMGCQISVDDSGAEILVTGNTCPRGKDYAIKEVTDPRRIVTSTVRVTGGVINRVSVKTKDDIPKNKIFDCMSCIRKVSVEAPVCIGDIIIQNVAGTGVDIVATKNVQCS